jgi:mono/diheme cytochrome c family protein
MALEKCPACGKVLMSADWLAYNDGEESMKSLLNTLCAKWFGIGVAATVILGALLAFFLSPLILKHKTVSPLENRLGTSRVLAAIPRSDKMQTNPVKDTKKNLSEGRTNFLINCSYCHGARATADTAVAKGLYPPAVSLLSGRVRSMTDGEIHWIATNGISFTGMPSFRDILSSRQRWQIVIYIRSLQRGSGS